MSTFSQLFYYSIIAVCLNNSLSAMQDIEKTEDTSSQRAPSVHSTTKPYQQNRLQKIDYRYFEIIKIYLAKGIKINQAVTQALSHSSQKQEDLDKALIAAAASGHIQIAEALLYAGANTSWKKIDGISPITIAESNGHQEIVTLLSTHAQLSGYDFSD